MIEERRSINVNIQVLRAIAAYSVVFHHVIDSLNNYIAHFGIKADLGSSGVNIFFVISGFIMAATTSGRCVSPLKFGLDRLGRICPMYWMLTIFCWLLIASGFSLFGKSPATVDLARSLLFITPEPILFVGWTLNLEIMFYLIFMITLVIRDERTRSYSIIGILILLFSCGRVVEGGSSLAFWTQGVIINFASGILIFRFHRHIEFSDAGLCGVLFLSVVALVGADQLESSWIKVCFFNICAFGIVASMVMLEENNTKVGVPFLYRQGYASYSIYLTHPIVIQLVGKISIMAGLNGNRYGAYMTAAVMFLLSLFFGTLIYKYIEVRANSLAKIFINKIERRLMSRAQSI